LLTRTHDSLNVAREHVVHPRNASWLFFRQLLREAAQEKIYYKGTATPLEEFASHAT
jgi:hypothetical protein